MRQHDLTLANVRRIGGGLAAIAAVDTPPTRIAKSKNGGVGKALFPQPVSALVLTARQGRSRLSRRVASARHLPSGATH